MSPAGIAMSVAIPSHGKADHGDQAMRQSLPKPLTPYALTARVAEVGLTRRV